MTVVPVEAAVTRPCVICGSPLQAVRPHARCCSAECRAEAGQLRRILDGEPAPWASVADRLACRRRRGRAALLRAVDGGPDAAGLPPAA